jgi:hypothetical protein
MVPRREAWRSPAPPAVAVAELEGSASASSIRRSSVDRLQAAERTQPDPTVADRQVAAFGQVVAELFGQVGVLEVARVAEAGREDDRAAVGPVLRSQAASGRSAEKAR